jgi:CubicO group peptidase (beta-lactamase class C family)
MIRVSILTLTSILLATPGKAAEFRFTPLPTLGELTWPEDDWVRAAPSPLVDETALTRAADSLTGKQALPVLGRTHVLLVLHSGKIVLERYQAGYGCNQIEHTMSVAKMLAPVMVGLLVRDARMNLDAPAVFPAWRGDDARRRITVRHLLTMTSGLRWRDPLDLINYGFGEGRFDLAAYVSRQPLAHAPGTHFQYSDGTPALIGDLIRRQVGGDRPAFAQFVRSELFEPFRMQKTILEFDRTGTWYGASGVRWSPCDLARFGLMLARDGTWRGQRLLPEGWMDFMRSPSKASLAQGLDATMPQDFPVFYGANVFLFGLPRHFGEMPAAQRPPIDAFGHYGFGGSALYVAPSRDLIIVMIGSGGNEMRGAMYAKLRIISKLADAFPAARLGSPSTTP